MEQTSTLITPIWLYKNFIGLFAKNAIKLSMRNEQLLDPHVLEVESEFEFSTFATNWAYRQPVETGYSRNYAGRVVRWERSVLRIRVEILDINI